MKEKFNDKFVKLSKKTAKNNLRDYKTARIEKPNDFLSSSGLVIFAILLYNFQKSDLSD